jgi:transposase
MSKGSGVSRSDRRRNARRERLRGLLPRDEAVLGIGLGDAKQALALVDHDMRVLWRRSPRCAAHELGGPIAEAVEAAARAGMSRLTVACEPTGSRWMQVQRLCGEAGVALVCVQPLVSHIAREQEDCTGHERDEPDAVLIARLASELHCYIPEELDESWAFLRRLGRRRAQLVTAATAAVLRVRDFLSAATAAVTAAGDPFKSMTWLAALEVATSRCGGDPARLAAAGEEEFLALVRDAVPGWGTSRPDRRIARKVLALADDPGAVGWSRRGLFRRISDELGDLQRARRQLKDAEADMAALLAGLGLGRLGDIPGLTLAGAAVILAETGDPRRYETSSSMVKHAGLSPSDNASGASEGASRISRRGRPSLRVAAWRATFAMLNWNPVMKARYEALVASAEESARAAAGSARPGSARARRPRGAPARPGRRHASRAPRPCCAGSTS